MDLDLYAGIAVTDVATSLAWYEALVGYSPSQITDDQAVWELAERRWLFLQRRPERAGHAMHTIVFEDLDPVVAGIAARGLELSDSGIYPDGIRMVLYVDPDGNEIALCDNRAT